MSEAPGLPLFTDGKAQGALRTIGEVAASLGIRQHVLRYWEQQFPMLRPLKRSGGRRYYRREDIELVGEIDRLINREGYTLKGARQALEKRAAQGAAAAAERDEGRSSSPAAPFQEDGAASTGPARPDAELVQRLAAVRDRLAAALAA